VAAGVGDREQVGEYRARVPESVTVGPLPVLPGVAPPLGGGDERHRSLGDPSLAARRRGESAAVVALAEHVEGAGVGIEVVDAGAQSVEVADDGVEVDVVELPRTGRRAKARPSAPYLQFLRDARRVVTERVDGLRVDGRGRRVAGRRGGVHSGDCRQRGVFGRARGLGPPRRCDSGAVFVHLVRPRPVRVIEGEAVAPEAFRGVFRPLVVLAGVDHAGRTAGTDKRVWPVRSAVYRDDEPEAGSPNALGVSTAAPPPSARESEAFRRLRAPGTTQRVPGVGDARALRGSCPEARRSE
jgi:hypothetical protein